MNIIKEGYPSGLFNFSDSIIAYFKTIFIIFPSHTEFHYLQKTGLFS